VYKAHILPVLLTLILFFPIAAAAQSPDSQAVPPTTAAPLPPTRFQEYLSDSVLSPGFYLKAVSSGVLDQVNKMPEEWAGVSGFSRRTTSRVGQAFVGETIRHSVAAALHHRVQYDACASCPGVWQRSTHALSRAFVAVRDDGRLAPNYSLLGAKCGPATLANAWYPPSYTAVDTVRSATVAVGIAAAFNVVREFTPELKRLAHIH
jgi:hypothetical protein